MLKSSYIVLQILNVNLIKLSLYNVYILPIKTCPENILVFRKVIMFLCMTSELFNECILNFNTLSLIGLEFLIPLGIRYSPLKMILTIPPTQRQFESVKYL